MSKEWTSIFNPFNSMKALVHADRFEAILKGKPKSPVVVNMDLTNACNYRCGFCMFGGLERASEQSSHFRTNKASLPRGYAQTLPKLWKDWGVKGVCLAGGGEPSLHPDCLEFIAECGKNGLDLGVATNGFMFDNPRAWDILAKNCEFVGFSIDAGIPGDYQRTKGVPGEFFQKVLNNLWGIAQAKKKMKSRVKIGYKFVLDKNNWQNIYGAARMAREMGCNTFQFRPAIDPNPGYFRDKVENIWAQIAQAQKELETEDFKVVGVQHKFNPDLTKRHNFDKCRATMLTSTWAADGKVYMCTDSRGEDWAYLTDHYPNPRKVIDYWGSKEHFKKVESIDFKRTCDRCTLSPHNEMFEEVFIKDNLGRNLI